jgi:hypothetical protein
MKPQAYFAILAALCRAEIQETPMSRSESADEEQAQLEALLQRAVAEAKPSSGSVARDAVNPAMIRHWCDAIGDDNPIYTEPDQAAQSRHGRIVAPPTMLQAWNMPGVRPRLNPVAGGHEVGLQPMKLLDEAGFTSVVATDCEQRYARYLELGDVLTLTTRLESISGLKKTALGPGYFLTTLYTFRDQHSEVVAEMQFRILKFMPPAAA